MRICNLNFHSREKDPLSAPICAKEVSKVFSDCKDFELRGIWPGGKVQKGVSVCWLDGVVSGKNVSEDVLRPLTDYLRLAGADGSAEQIEHLLRGAVYSYSVKRREKLSDVVDDILHGFCAILFDDALCALCFEVKTENNRSISTPTVEKTIKGGKDAFIETLRTNTSLVRRKLRTAQLKLLETTVGRRSGTQVGIFYVEGIANGATLAELRRRIDAIDIDGLISAGNLEQYIVDHPNSPFPQLLHTERPDKFATELLAGRIGILVDGLPIGFLLPATLPRFLKVAEDRAQHFITASLLTLLRYFSTLITVLFPAFLVAISMYHQEMIPAKLLQSMIDAKQKVPFSVAMEVISMLIAFELLMEAGLRLPDPVGDTVSIIGALIVGQSAVEARVVSPIAVIVVATAAICGFTQPSRDMGAALRLVRFAMVGLAIALGMYGIMLGSALLVWYLCTLENFGIPYVSPMAEGGWRENLKAFLRPPLPRDKFREEALRTGDKRNQK